MQNRTKIEAKYHQYLQKKNLKSSKRRDLILQHILSSGGHFTIEDIYQRIIRSDPSIGIATIYRAIKLFVDAEILIEHWFGEKKGFFEIRSDQQRSHGHLICQQCGKIIEFTTPEIGRMKKNTEETFNFDIKLFKIEIFGVCADCLEKLQKKPGEN